MAISLWAFTQRTSYFIKETLSESYLLLIYSQCQGGGTRLNWCQKKNDNDNFVYIHSRILLSKIIKSLNLKEVDEFEKYKNKCGDPQLDKR